MAFTDLLFLFVFLPLSWLLYTYFFSRRPLANGFLFVVSLIFCAWGSLYSLMVLLAVLVITYVSANGLEQTEDDKKRRNLLFLTVGIFLLILFVYRYLPVWFSFLSIFHSGAPAAIRMPAGLSFYLFSCLSCIFDVYYRKAPAPESFIDLGVFAAFFARLNMGPIAHYAKDRSQLQNHPQTRVKSAKGVMLFLQGMFMKVILADSLAIYLPMLEADRTWLGAVVLPFIYGLRLYFDFAGYSRMARGLGSLFGFTIPVNFNKPYSALSVQDFWRRWHISLTDWFRDYVYIPLGGNRVTSERWMMNVFVVWLLTGLWHGAAFGFLLWGLLQGILIVMEHNVYGSSMEKWPMWIRHVYVVCIEMLSWLFFSAPSFGFAIGVFSRLFGIGVSGFAGSAPLFTLSSGLILLIICAVGCTELPSAISRWIRIKTGASWKYWQFAGYALIFVVALSSLVSATSRTFLYAVF